ncbi:MAG: sigma-54-dependent Fis family transcriptional regulator [Acidobacteria bacterium]|nr:sigma-54-dependent Fis family transcriptional regulator [Acidobacteriota bacterium]
MTRPDDPENLRILLVEDEAELRATLEGVLRDLSFEVDAVADSDAALAQLRQNIYDVLLTDLRLPGGGSGEEIVCQSKQLYPDLIAVVMTGFGDISSAVRVMKLGASDYIQKPFLKDELILRLRKALEERRLRWESRALQDRSRGASVGNLIGESMPLLRVKELIHSVAPKRSTVLLVGETGTGKELVARAIHQNSPRKDYPLVTVNCGAIPATLMEAEFFGHEKGAFTDAAHMRTGRLEQSNRGTLFLDEIGTMPYDLQGKLLRVLQERECQRIGGSQTIKLDIRFIAATNVTLEEKVKSGVFREDLYYRLNVFPIFLPSLRERREDIPLLLPHLLEKICQREGISPKRMSQEAMKVLMQYDWPGNVRQLENVAEMAIILAGERDYLLPEDLPPLCHPPEADNAPRVEVPPEGVDFNRLVSQFERALIEEGLKRAHGRRSQAAELLGLKRTTLLEKLKRLETVSA